VPAYLKRQSVKNGWLLIIKYDNPQSLLRDCFAVIPYQAKILAGILTVERTSLPAVADTLKLTPSMRRKRREIRQRRRRSREDIRRWFE
jgi:hypothetical protein